MIVESPTKARTLKRFLGPAYQIESSMGHLRDLPTDKLGVAVKHDFQPTWVLVKGKGKSAAVLKKAAKKAKEIILATDLDREGEAIAWHVAQLLATSHQFSRIVFHEITKQAIEKALQKPRQIDLALVQAQKTRRILDRLVGYKISPLLWRKVRQGLSAGRVQSVVVRLIVEREKEIKRFQAEDYWRILAAFPFIAELTAKKEEKYEISQRIKLFAGRQTIKKTTIASEKDALGIIRDLTHPFIVREIEKKESFSYPPPPFITSTLQQTAGYRFGWSGKMTMSLAQNLYENGLITYHRTDSTHLAKSAVDQIRRYIQDNYGNDYLPEKARIYQTKSKVAQEAHEAIRPTKVEMTNAAINGLRKHHQKLYQLIWQRAVACQMAPARLEKTDLKIVCGDYLFASKGQRLLFAGYLKVYPLKISENLLPALKKGDRLDLVSLGSAKNTTSPPARYTEAALIKTLEKEGIGRPSTYAPIISLVQNRQYVEKIETKFQPTNLGEAVNEFLVKNFLEIVEIPFTAKMEADLDGIANAKKEWLGVLREFWQPFSKKLTQVKEKAERVKIATEKTGEKCEKCGHDLVIRIGRFGKFIGCSNFPDCKYTRPFVEKVKGVKCPDCGAEVVIKKTKRNKQFYGCGNYPNCKWASWTKPKFSP